MRVVCIGCITISQGIQTPGRTSQLAFNRYGTRRGFNGLQQLPVLKVACNPAALHQHYLTAGQLQWRKHEKTWPPLHLPVVQIHRVCSQPLAVQCNRAIQPVGQRCFTQPQLVVHGASIQGACARLRLHGIVQPGFLRCALQLPKPQSQPYTHTEDASYRRQPPPQVAPLACHTQLSIMGGMTYAIALFFLAILVSLAAAGFFMLRKSDAEHDAARSKNMARALTWRIVLSVVLFLCLLLAWKLGYIQPTGLPIGK